MIQANIICFVQFKLLDYISPGWIILKELWNILTFVPWLEKKKLEKTKYHDGWSYLVVVVRMMVMVIRVVMNRSCGRMLVARIPKSGGMTTVSIQ